MTEPAPSPAREILSVSQLNRAVAVTLEGNFPLLWVEGEISNLARPGSGHWYFSLKDPQAQVRCAMFRNRNQLLRFRPDNGQQVLLRARVSLYQPRGDYQLIIEHMEEAGAGALQRAFEELKQRLAAEGLFDAAHKRPLPSLPRRIGVVTSPTGAAIRDILTVLERRFPAIPVLLYPVAVQGEGAAAEIARAIATASARDECDVLIVGRGGGSLEDLWAFNEEPVARAIHRCGIPVVSAVGHEVDVTIADFAADVRAATPSAAAELLSPERDKLAQGLARELLRLTAALRAALARRRQRLEHLLARLRQLHPGRRLQERAQRLDELELRLRRGWAVQLRRRRERLETLRARLLRHQPNQRIELFRRRLEHAGVRLEGSFRQGLGRHRQALAALARALDAVSPLRTLERGYAIVRRPDGVVIRSAAELNPGDPVEARLARGRLRCRVEEVFDA